MRNERYWSQRIVRRYPGTMTIENSVSQGTPDLCIPTQSGWKWIELKIKYGSNMIVKKSQYASTSREIRLLPEHLHRYYVIVDSEGNAGFVTASTMLLLDKKARKDDIAVDISYVPFTLGLFELTDSFGCLQR